MAIAAPLFHLADSILLLAALAWTGQNIGWSPPAWIATTLACSLCLLDCGVYSFPRGERLRAHLSLVVATLGVVLLTCAAVAFADNHAIDPRDIGPAGAGVMGVGLLHLVWWMTVRRWRANGSLTPNIVIVGATPKAKTLINSLLKAGGVNIIGIFDDRASRSPESVLGMPVLGSLDDMIHHHTLPAVDLILIAVPERAQARIEPRLGSSSCSHGSPVCPTRSC